MIINIVSMHCSAKKGAVKCMPFDDDAVVFKVHGKIFALYSLRNHWLNLKCEPEKAIERREKHLAVLPGYHMNKKQWNTIVLDGSIPWETLCEWIDESYMLVVKRLPKKVQKELLQN